ncbi:MAG: hypothetical protein WD645_06080 [Dehalococcoidia bacterium]
MTKLVSPVDGTWATFGTWASKTAGGFIRQEELPAQVRRALDRLGMPAEQPPRQLASGLPDSSPLALLLEELDRLTAIVALWIAQGNLVVFEEIGGAFARFLDTFGDGGIHDDDKLQTLLDGFSPGDPEPDRVLQVDGHLQSTEEGGQGLLIEMLRCYARAAREDDPERKAQLALLGNAYGGIHEQTRLQPYIAHSLDQPVDTLADGLLQVLLDRMSLPKRWRHKLGELLRSLANPIAAWLLRAWEEGATLFLMKMRLPDGVLYLGRDVPALPGEPLFPRDLSHIRQPELKKILRRYRVAGSGGRLSLIAWLQKGCARLSGRRYCVKVIRRSAASDWVQLTQRMRYILELFRSRQQDAALLDQPFTREQRQTIAGGRIPAGPL